MTDKQPETNELCRWFDEEDGFKQGTAAPHKWVLQANSEIHRLQARVQELEADLVAEAGRTAELKLRANQMAEQHRMQSAMNAEARAELAEEKEATDNWRRLALQFDGHRMQALGFLKALLRGEKDMETGARGFIASPPMPGERVLAERLAALVKASLLDAGILQAVARLRDATEHHLSLCKKFGPEGFHFDPSPEDVLLILNHLQQQAPECWCSTCRPITLQDIRFVVCPVCGNKRCPHAHNHDLACTGSNAVGQAGSSWEGVKPITKEKQ